MKFNFPMASGVTLLAWGGLNIMRSIGNAAMGVVAQQYQMGD